MMPRRSSRRRAAFGAVFGLRSTAPAAPREALPVTPPTAPPETKLIDARDQDRDRTWRRHNGGPPLDDHHIPLTVCGVDGRLLRILERSGFVDRVGQENVVASRDLVFNSIATSVRRAAALAADEDGPQCETPDD